MSLIKISDEIIEKKAYMGERNLSKAVLTPLVSSVGEWAFANCNALKEVWIPDTIKEVSRNSFFNCNALKRIVIYVEKDGEMIPEDNGDAAALLALMVVLWPADTKEIMERAVNGELYAELDKRLPSFLSQDDLEGFKPFLAGGEEDYDTNKATEIYGRERRYKKAALIYEALISEKAGHTIPPDIRQICEEWLKDNNPSAAFGVVMTDIYHKKEYADLYFEMGLDILSDYEELMCLAEDDTELKARIIAGRTRLAEVKDKDFFDSLLI